MHILFLNMLSKEQNVAVCDAMAVYSSGEAGIIKKIGITSRFN